MSVAKCREKFPVSIPKSHPLLIPLATLTLLIQHESPGADKEANWLPAPKGPFWCAMRLYRPQQAALDGTWKNPPMMPVE